MKKLNKRGSARDVILLVVILLVLGLGFLLFHKVANDVVDKMQDTEIISDSPIANSTLTTAGELTDHMDWLFVVVYVGFLIGLIISGFLVETHPIFFIVYVILFIIAIFLSAMVGNIWYLTSTSSAFTTTVTKFSITDFMMGKLPLFTGIAGMIGLIIIYARSRRGEE